MLFLYALFLRTVDTLRLRREEGQTTAEYALAIPWLPRRLPSS